MPRDVDELSDTSEAEQPPRKKQRTAEEPSESSSSGIHRGAQTALNAVAEQPPQKKQRTAEPSSSDIRPGVVRLPASVDELSSSSEEVAEQPVRRKRKRFVPRRKRPKLDDEIMVRKMLAMKCGRICKLGCKKPFQTRSGFQRLMAFRKEWTGYHKLDQDQTAPRPRSEFDGSVMGMFYFRAWVFVHSICEAKQTVPVHA